MRKRKYSTLSPRDEPAPELDTPLPTVHNIVATSQIGSPAMTSALDLNKTHKMLPFSFYDQQKFAAITVRLHNPDCTTLLFSSGKLVVTGCRSWYECVYASLFIADLLSGCLPGHNFQLHACDVQNMVAHVEIPVGEGGALDLQAMYTQLALNCTYQRKMFPGLIYRPESSPVVLLCFFSGKVVITGGKTMRDVFNGWARLWPTLRRFVVPSYKASNDHGGDAEQSLPLDGDAAADDPLGRADSLVEAAGGGGGGQEMLRLADPCELQSLCDDLATESATLALRAGIAAGADQALREPGPPHTPIVEDELLIPCHAAELEAGVVLPRGDIQADQLVVGIAEILGPEAGGFPPHDGETLVNTLEEELDVAKRVLAHPPRQAIDPVIALRRAQECDG
jgi:transcription initiation factor TFIID TATA-box-binding protein